MAVVPETFTFDSDFTLDRDKVRFEVGDTGPDNYLVSDQMIEYCVSVEGTLLRAAARIAEHLAARFARETQERQANLTLDHGWKQQHFEILAKKLRARSGSVPITSNQIRGIGGEGRFKLGMHDNDRGSIASSVGSQALEEDG